MAAAQETTYKIAVKTSDILTAGTDARVFLQIFGENGSSDEMEIKAGSETLKKKKFEEGQEDVFSATMQGLGNLSKLRIWHDNTGPLPGWHLEYVQIVDKTTGKIYLFPCKRWLATDEDDKQISRELTCSSTETIYKVTVKTSDIAEAGTDANVFLQIFGENGSSDELKLKDSATHKVNKFEKGQEDIFSFSMKSQGNLNKIRIGHDNTGVKPGWHLAYVDIVDKATEKSYKFLCNRWLAKDEDDKQIIRELPAEK